MPSCPSVSVTGCTLFPSIWPAPLCAWVSLIGSEPNVIPADLDAFERDATVQGWFAPAVVDTPLGIRRADLAIRDGADAADLSRRYAALH